MGYGAMHGIPMVATSPVRHESPVGMNPVEIQSYEPPWKQLTDFALHTDLDRLHPNNSPHFQHLVNQVHTLKKYIDYTYYYSSYRVCIESNISKNDNATGK